jgi:uncharacterized protein (DUF2336 family)
MQKLAQREHLPLTVAEKLITRVSGQLAQALQSKYGLGKEALREEEEKARESATLVLIRRASTSDEMDRLIQQLITFKRMTPSLLAAALAHGYVNFFEHSLAELADVPVSNARKLLSDPGGMGFRALYGRANLPEHYYQPLRRLHEEAQAVRREHKDAAGAPFALQLVQSLRQAGGEGTGELIAMIENCAG